MQSQNESTADAVTEPGSHERGTPVIETPADVYKHYYAPQHAPAAAVRAHKSILKSAPISTDSKPLSSAAAASQQLAAAGDERLAAAGGERLTAAGDERLAAARGERLAAVDKAADETAQRIRTQTVSVVLRMSPRFARLCIVSYHWRI